MIIAGEIKVLCRVLILPAFCALILQALPLMFGILPESNILLWLTDCTDCTDSFARTTRFSTTEMTDLTDFVSIACSLRH